MRTWASRFWHDYSSQLLVKEMYLQSVERVMILNCFRIDCIIKKFVLSCCWFSNTFSLRIYFWFYFLSMSMSCKLIREIFNEVFLFFFSLNFFLFLKNFDEILNNNIREIFCDHYFVNAQFMFYFLIVCYYIYVKLVHINFRWIETIICRVILNEMFDCNFLIHVYMFRFC